MAQNDILTPNIDNLAREGVVFSNGYVTHRIVAHQEQE